MHKQIYINLPVADLPHAQQEYPGIYGHAFADPDGHVWELTYMAQDAAAQGPAS
ncbi:hypothetical protein [Burkholderia sp. Bp8963]|uniref:hypothetical protein n=1 Tax=Burkholderia sp. Bp8963 TaxID=2184547 RepID=UPI001639C22D|nr:hypothetical protein [Burkholderia sp. Bp8963]